MRPTTWTLAAPDERPHRLAVVLPLRARGRTLGALALARGPSRPAFDPADLALAEDLAGRAAIALDNARLYRDIQQADRQKNEFLAMLAHELRNPLAPIRNAVEMLRLRGHDQPERRLGPRRHRPPGRRTWSGWSTTCSTCRASRAARSACSSSRSTWPTVVASAVETSRPLIDAGRHELDVTLPAEPVWVDGDPARLAQVLANLLNNAAKYTEPGGRIAVTAAAEDGAAVVRVRDTGIGIPPEMLGASSTCSPRSTGRWTGRRAGSGSA